MKNIASDEEVWKNRIGKTTRPEVFCSQSCAIKFLDKSQEASLNSSHALKREVSVMNSLKERRFEIGGKFILDKIDKSKRAYFEEDVKKAIEQIKIRISIYAPTTNRSANICTKNVINNFIDEVFGDLQ